MTGPSRKELNQYRKAREKINNIINQYGSIKNLNELVLLHKSDLSDYQNFRLKEASTAAQNYQCNQKKVETFKYKYGNLDDDLNHCAPDSSRSEIISKKQLEQQKCFLMETSDADYFTH